MERSNPEPGKSHISEAERLAAEIGGVITFTSGRRVVRERKGVRTFYKMDGAREVEEITDIKAALFKFNLLPVFRVAIGHCRDIRSASRRTP